jgi:WD40 repeat protein
LTASGKLCVQSFLDVLNGTTAGTPLQEDLDAFDAEITCLRLISDGTLEHDLVFAGFDDGSLRVWDAETLRLIASFTVSAERIQQVLIVEDAKASRLANKALLISQDGSIAVFSTQELRV